MAPSDRYLNPAEAARRLGVSTKALRLYEQHGLLVPVRSAARWRAYGPEQMARARSIVDLRAVGLSLRQIAEVLQASPGQSDAMLAAHQADLGVASQRLAAQILAIEALRGTSQNADTRPTFAFDLPWPWAGERFVLRQMKTLTYIVGPLGSGKTRLARLIAETIPKARFLGPDRSGPGAPATGTADRDEIIASLVEQADASDSPALLAIMAALQDSEPSAFVIDMIEDGLGEPAQRALMRHLRHGRRDTRPLFLMTRSAAILDPACLGSGEAIIFCPANHNPPMLVHPQPGSPGYEALMLSLASPTARARLAAGPAPAPTQRHAAAKAPL